MRERINILFRKVQNELKPSGIKQGERITFYRVFMFVFSKRGAKRLLNLFNKALRVVFRFLIGEKAFAPTYGKWLKKENNNSESLDKIEFEISKWDNKPLISIIIPVYNPNIDFLKEAINSVYNQTYKNWEIIISDDKSNVQTIEFLKNLEANNPKIKLNLKKENEGISNNLNDAIQISIGDYLGFLDQDDLLDNNALFYVANEIISKKSDLIYTDEDKIDSKNRRSSPFFKPDYSPHSLLSRNYINHFTVLSKSILNMAGGFRKDFDGAQDHDLLLRVCEKTNKISHVPKILYHWRIHEKSTSTNPDSKKWAFTAGEKAIYESIKRQGFDSKVKTKNSVPGNYDINIKIKKTPKVSIIIPTKDKSSILKTCLESVFTKTSYANFEVIAIDNNSIENETFELFSHYSNKFPDRFYTYKYTKEFNFSALMNFGSEKAKGEYLLLLNNDTEIINADYIERLLSLAQLKNAGAVGAKLFFPNNKIQHVGVVLGIRGIVGHVFVGSEGDNPGYFQSNNTITNYSAVTAACLMVSKEKFLSVGGFDEELAVEYNDVDFCLKLYKKGLFNIYTPYAKLFHFESLTRGHPSSDRKSNQRHLKEAEYFLNKWGNLIKNDPFYNKNLSRDYTEFQYDV